MSHHQKKSYLEITRKRYKQATRAKKSLILAEFAETCGYHRKYAIRLLNQKPVRRKPTCLPKIATEYDTLSISAFHIDLRQGYILF